MSGVPAYERDPYQRELEVEVERVEEEAGRRWATLDDTVLYPEGGGQPADRGWLDEVEVLDVRREGGEIRHLLAEPVAPGRARLRLDWDRRYDHMQQHTAQHLLSAIALRRFEWATRSFHIGPELCDIQLAVPPPSDRRVAELERAVVEEIAAARPISCRRVEAGELERLEVRSRGLPRGHRGEVRLVEIEGLDRNTCGGTHLRNTAEVGVVKLLRAEPLRGGCRLYWVAGGRVRRRLANHETRSAQLRSLFDTGDDQLVELAGKKLAQLAEAERRARRLEAELARAAAAELAGRGDTPLEAHFAEAAPGFARQVAGVYLETGGVAPLLVTTEGEAGMFFALAAPSGCGIEAAETGRRLAELLDGRGGGAGAIYQGKAGSLARRSEAVDALRASTVARARRPGRGTSSPAAS